MITQNGFRIYELARRRNFNDKCNGAKMRKWKNKRNETEGGLECGKGSGMINATSERRVRIYLYASFLYSSCALRFILDLQKQSNKAGGEAKLLSSITANKANAERRRSSLGL